MTLVLQDALDLARAGQIDAALQHLSRPSAAPNEVVDALHAHLALTAGRPHEALRHATRAVAAGGGVKARLLEITALRRLRRFDDALAAIQTALSHDPNNADLLMQRAVYAHALRDPGGARDWVERALAINPDCIDAERLIARLDQEDGARTAATDRLQRLLSRDLGPDRAGTIGLDLARIWDQLGRHEEAWTTMRTAQAHRLRTPELKNCKPELWLQRAKAAARWCRESRPDTAPAPIFPDPPIFIVGMPRSGTTLVEQILGAHSTLSSLDERPVLQRLCAQIPERLGRAFRYPQDLGTLTLQERARLIEAWAECVRPFRQAPGTIVDKMPLNLPWLPLAWSLFPDSAMILAVRDPRDSVVSGLFQDLEPNDAMRNLADPNTSANLAHQVFSLWDALSTLPAFRGLEQRYEDLVRTPNATTQRLMAHLGRPWEPEQLQYFVHAKQRPISTPSREAVSHPLSRRAVGRWKNYARQLEPIQPVLDPWLRRWDYETSTRPG
ncbi:MAG: sulfotransferase [Myxococcota bacterium]